MTTRSGKRRFRWLHVSDFHIRSDPRREGDVEYEPGVVLGELVAAFRRGGSCGDWRPDVIFCTGDVAHGGKAEEYAVAEKLLRELMDTTGVPPERTFIVPGNHDLDRAALLPGLAIDLPGREETDRFFGDPRSRAFAFERFRNFADFHHRVTGAPLLAEAPFTVREVRAGAVRAAVLGLNTAWLASADDMQGKLVLSERLLREALAVLDEAEKAAGPFDLKVAMLHHPTKWLRPFEVSAVEGLLEAHCHVVLHGHEHRDRPLRQQTPEGTNLVLGCGAGYQGRGSRNSAFLVDADLDADLATIRTLRFDDRTVGVWRVDGAPFTVGLTRPAATEVRSAVPEPAAAAPDTGFGREIEAYLAKVKARYARVDMAGFETRLRVPILLEDLYVPLRATCDLRATGGGRYADAEDALKVLGRGDAGREVVLTEVFRARERWMRRCGFLILGDPGSGKTTHLKRLLLWVAGEGPGSLGLPSGMVPVFLPLRNLSDLTRGLDTFVEKELSDPHLAVPGGFGRKLLERGNLLFLLDGFDEVSDRAVRASVAKWIGDAAAVRPDCRFVVTCRYAGYGPEVELPEDFLELHLRPLDTEQAERFIRTWFGLVETSLATDEEQAALLAEERAEKLIGILRSPDFRVGKVFELTRNPLLLTAICLVQRDREKLPHRRAELYDECVNVLLERWREVKKLPVHFSASDARRVLQPVALFLHGEEGRTRAPEEDLSPVLVDGLASVKRGEVKPGELLRTIRDESGLLTGWGDRTYGFMHLGFQEYLAAREIRTRSFLPTEELDRLARRFGDSWWREVTLLLLALEEPSLFEPFMRRVLEVPALAQHVDLLDACIEDSIQVFPGPFLDFLRRDAGTDPAFWARQAIALRVLERIAPERVDALAERLAGHPSPEISGRVAERRRRAGVRTITAPRGGYELIAIPGGRFQMGSPESEEGRYGDEGPVHEVTVPAFHLGRAPVTNEEYAQFLKENAGVREPEYWGDGSRNQPRQPVVGVSWEEAKAYCEWAGLRLPSEAEWEYACRAGTTTMYWSGDDEADLARVGWYQVNSDGRLHAVGEKPANPFGLFDMHGNVWEWCEDAGHGSYKGAPADGSAWVEGGDRARVFRGGCFFDSARDARSAYRAGTPPGLRWDNLGFRPARSVTP